jgi:hypothetical protein
MDCEEKTALLALYINRVRSFSRAVNTLHQARDEKWQKGFMMHWDAAQDALTACIAAQNHLESHVSAHRCDENVQILEKAVA